MSITAQILDKREAWQRLYDWDFSQFDEFALSPAETGIASATVVVSPNDGILTIGQPAISGTKVQLLIGAGTPGVLYTITVSILTAPTSYPLSWDGLLNVLP